MGYIVRHATRTLVKVGHRYTLALLGIDPDRSITVVDVAIPSRVILGGQLDISVTLHAADATEAVVDYVLAFAGRPGRPGGRKVYKLKRLTVPAGQTVTVGKSHPLRAGMTTRTIHPGAHEIEVLVNGTPRARRRFAIMEPGG